MYAFFKLFHSIKDAHEIELARLELENLVGEVVEIRNFIDLLVKKPLRSFLNATHSVALRDREEKIRFQDCIMHELPYGRVQGFYCNDIDPRIIRNLVIRLGYTREIYLIAEDMSSERLARIAFPKGVLGKNYTSFPAKNKTALRIITNQFFLEKSEFVTKVTPTLPRKRIMQFVDRLFDYLMKFTYRIPASSRARVGKRFLDYLSEREEPSLYLAHGLHPYKGKFHPKMTRALINIVHPKNKGKLIDNFAGSGTLLVEASMMGFDSYGIEINPMSVLMANAKCALMLVDEHHLDVASTKFLKLLRTDIEVLRQQAEGQSTLESMSYQAEIKTVREIQSTTPEVYEEFSVDNTLEEILIARNIVEKEFDGDIQEILTLAIAMAISDLKGKKRKEFMRVIEQAVEDTYRRSLLFNYIRSIIPLKVGRGRSFLADSANFAEIAEIARIGGNVNSPPYSTALDYIKNDLEQLSILGMVKSPEELKQLESNMGGNPRLKHDKSEMQLKIEANSAGLPPYALRVIRALQYFDRTGHAYRLYTFYDLMKQSFSEQFRVLKKGGRIATVIGNNHFKLTDKIEGLSVGSINIGSEVYDIQVSDVVDNVRTIDVSPIRGKRIREEYADTVPIRVSITEDPAKSSQNGVYIEVENERVILLLGNMIGFVPELVINRHLEKTRRGNIRYEAIVVMKKPS
ncbi:MAG: TRM11 family SAM-dependent methyltransferase [Candidatus Thorarchaeota archaeon]